MADKIKGLTLEIGGNITPLEKGIKSLNVETKSLQKELRGVESLLKMDPKNIELLKQKQELLNSAIGETKTKLEVLRDSKSKIDEDMASGTALNEKQYHNLQREIVSTEQSLKRLESTLKTSSTHWADTADKLQKFGDKSVEVGGNLTKGVTLPIAAAGAVAFKFAADLEDALGATDQIFKGSSEEVKKWSSQLETYYGIAKSEALTYANTMGAMLQNIGQLSEVEAAKQSQILIELAGDLTAMFGGTTESAIQALTGALKGNNTMLDNYGMGVNDATIKTKAFEMKLYDGTGQMTLATKQAATLALIMEQTADAQGQAAREADGASGSMRALKTELKNLATSLGEVLLPVLTPIVEKLKEFFEKISSLTEGQKKTLVVVLALAAAVGPLLIIVGKMATGISAIITAVGIVTPIIAGLGGIAGIASIGVGALGTAVAFLLSPIGLAMVAIGLLVGAIVWLRNKFKKETDGIIGDSKNVADGVDENLKSIYNPNSPYTNYVPIGEDINKGLADGIKNSGDLPLDVIDGQSQELADKIKENISQLDSFGSAISTALTNQYKESLSEQVAIIDAKMSNEKFASEKTIELIKTTTEREKTIIGDKLSKLKESTDEKISEYKRDYDYRMLYLNADTETKVDGFQAKIDAIDNLTKKETDAQNIRKYQDEMNELGRARLLAKTSEERDAISKKFQEINKQRNQELRNQERNNDKAKLQEQIEQVKKEAIIIEEKLKQELEDKQLAAKKELDEKTKFYKKELDLLKQSSDNKLKIENDRIKQSSDGLALEKTEIKKHYDTLLQQDNIQAEARALIIQGNNNDIIKLLNSYNPKWQNAGQSFGDSLVNGLNNAKTSVQTAVDNLMKIPNLTISIGSNTISTPKSVLNDTNRAVTETGGARGTDEKVVNELKNINNSIKNGDRGKSNLLLNNILGAVSKETSPQPAVFKIGESTFATAVIKSVRKVENQTGKTLLL